MPTKFVGDDDLVIGIASGGEAKAYPLCILESHECVNDRIADQSVAVTYHPLCRSALVFDRDLGGEERLFSNSCLIWNSNGLLFDKQREASRESLFSQLGLRAVSGPAAVNNQRLKLLPSILCSWGAWRSHYPQTTILTANTGYRYNYNPRFSQFARYYASDSLLYPYKAKLDSIEGMEPKEDMLIVQCNEQVRLYRASDIMQFSEAKPGRDHVDGCGLELFAHPQLKAPFITCSEPAAKLGFGRCYWFAASALQEGAKLVQLAG